MIGADGLHSNVRAPGFGPEQFVRDLGLYASIFTAPNRLNLDYFAGCSVPLAPPPAFTARDRTARRGR